MFDLKLSHSRSILRLLEKPLHIALSFAKLLLMVVNNCLAFIDLVLKGKLLIYIQLLGGLVLCTSELICKLAPDTLFLRFWFRHERIESIWKLIAIVLIWFGLLLLALAQIHIWLRLRLLWTSLRLILCRTLVSWWVMLFYRLLLLRLLIWIW